MRIIIFLLFPLFLSAQNTSVAVSDSIRLALSDLILDTVITSPPFDTIIQPLESFYDTNNDIYVYVAQVSGGQFKALSHSIQPNVFKFDNGDLVKAWHVYEIENWILGATGTNYQGFSFTGSGPYMCTLTISGDTWIGYATDETNALGRAFYNFLFDPAFSTYLQ